MTSQAASPSSFKTRLRTSLERAAKGESPSVGQWLEFHGYSLARTIAPLGEDWVLIDTEHGCISDTEMYLQVGAISSAGVSPIVRVLASEPYMIKRALDCGAHAIMVPMIETAAQAEAVVRASKYLSPRWPHGCRGAGAMYAPVAFGMTDREYLLNANEATMVIVQIESRLAVQNVAEIAAVEGVDMLFVGPNDLANSMGFVAFDHAGIGEVQEAIGKVLREGREKGKYVGHFALDAETAARKWRQGFHFVNCGADIVAVTKWMGSEMGKLRALVEEGKKAEANGGRGENEAVKLNGSYN